MPTRKKARRTAGTRPARTERLSRTWKDTRRALRSAEERVSRKVAELVQQTGLPTREVVKRAEAWRTRLGKEGRKARRTALARLAELQQRARRDGRALGRGVDDAVARALAALNIPTRQEVQELSRQVERLSARVDRLRR
jgi:polyhydroxyalkanoate synthesis regulator phasin